MSQLVSAILTQAQRVAAVDPVTALDLCDRVAELAGDRDDYCLVRGQCHLAVGDAESARFWIARAMVLGSSDPAGLLSLGAFLCRAGDRSRASAVYRTALAWLPDLPALYNGLANAELERHAAQAERAVARGLLLDPRLPEALTNAGVLAHRRGNREAAIRLLRQALAEDPALPPALTNLGTVLQSGGRAAEAENVLRRTLRLAPDAAALNTMGVVCLSRGDTDAAEAWFRRAIAVSPTFSESLFNLGSLRQGLGDIFGARIIYERADADSFRAIGLFNTGIAYIGEERYGEAVSVLKDAQALAPSEAGIRNQLGVALAGLKRPREAAASIRAALNLSPTAPEYWYNLGLVAYKLEDTWASLRAYERSILLDFHSPELAFSGIGVTKLQAGDPAGGEAVLKISLALAPGNQRTYSNIGVAFLQTGQSDDGIAAFMRALRCVRTDPNALMLSLGQAYLNRREIETGLTYVHRSLVFKPDSRVALFCIGYAHLVQDRLTEAEKYFARAVQMDPEYWLAWNNFGGALYKQGRFDEAVACFRRLVTDVPNHALAHFNLAIAYESSKRFQDAELCYRLAIQHDPGMAAACNNLGVLLQRSGRHLEALEVLEKAAESTPESPGVHSNLGNLHQKLGNNGEARRCCRRTIVLEPAYHLGHYNLGSMLLDAGEVRACQPHFRRAIAIDPQHVSGRYNLACAMQQTYTPDAAIALYREVIAADGSHYRALNNLALALQWAGHNAESLELYKRAERVAARQGLDPSGLGELCAPDADRLDDVQVQIQAAEDQIAGDAEPLQQGGVGSMFPDAVWNRSLLDLTMGNLEAGWDGYEFRWHSATAAGKRSFRQPLWDGKRDITGKRLLIWREQGIGDEIMFGSCVPDLASTGARVTLECSPKLRPLFQRSFPGAQVVGPSDRPDPEREDFDVHLPIGSLPRLYRRSLTDFPSRKGFLIPDPERVAYWRGRLAALGPGPYVGMAWRSRVQTLSRSHHYTQIEDWEPILRTPGVVLINMQYDDASAETARVREAFGVAPHTLPGIDMWNDLDDVAALLQALDLLLSVSVAVMSLAGGVGTPTWLLSLENFGWPSLGTDHFPWYPSIRVFPRPLSRPWLSVLQGLAGEFQAALPGLRRSPADT
ncbi:tetratricopeptide repeat protein [Azospirillum sp. sgz301742]